MVHKMMRPTAFLFSSGRRARLLENGPTEFLYGFAELERTGRPVAMFEEADLGTGNKWPRLLEAASARIAGLAGVSPRLAIRFLKALRGPLAEFEVLVATTQSIGMALAALGAAGFHDKCVILMTMGLLEPDASNWRQALHRLALRRTTLAALSKPEGELIRTWCGQGIDVIDFTFGVDLDFWSPAPRTVLSDEVLSIGNDRARDYETLLSAWRPEFPRLTIITSLSISSDKPNVVIERGDWRGASISDVDLRERFRQARLIVTPVRETIQPSGQSATLQAMACGRPVIMSANKGLWDPALMYSGICRLVPPGDAGMLSDAVASLLMNTDAAEKQGRAARRALLDKNISAKAMASQIEKLAS